MNIRFATDGDTEALKKMWLDTFSDSKQFVDWNFENNYTPKNVMICEKDGKIASSLHLIPYTLTLSGKTLNVDLSLYREKPENGISNLDSAFDNGYQITPLIYVN